MLDGPGLMMLFAGSVRLLIRGEPLQAMSRSSGQTGIQYDAMVVVHHAYKEIYVGQLRTFEVGAKK